MYVDQMRDDVRGRGDDLSSSGRVGGLTGTGAVLLLAGISAVAGLLDVLAGSALRLIFAAGLVLGTLIASLLVRRRDLLTVVFALQVWLLGVHAAAVTALRLAAMAPSLGGVETLVLHPASTSHRQLDAAGLSAAAAASTSRERPRSPRRASNHSASKKRAMGRGSRCGARWRRSCLTLFEHLDQDRTHAASRLALRRPRRRGDDPVGPHLRG